MRIYFLVFLALSLFTTGAAAQNTSTESFVDSVPRFVGTLVTRVEGQTRKVRIDYRTWSIAPGSKLDGLPWKIKGDVVYELHSGRLTTRQDGNEVERKPGTFWTVKEGQKQTLETFDDSVVLRTIAVQK